MKRPMNQFAEIPVVISYEDINGFIYEAKAYVSINSSYEIESVRFSIIESFDETGEPLDIPVDNIIFQQLEVMAGAKAIEKACHVDFEKEPEIE